MGSLEITGSSIISIKDMEDSETVELYGPLLARLSRMNSKAHQPQTLLPRSAAGRKLKGPPLSPDIHQQQALLIPSTHTVSGNKRLNP